MRLIVIALAIAFSAFGEVPLYFEPNIGQAPPDVRYLARGGGVTLFITARDTLLATQSGAVRLRMHGARPARTEGLDPLFGVSNYFRGNDRSKWRTGIPHYARVAARGVYPGIDLVFYGHNRRLEYDFVVAPGANPDVIQLAYDGVTSIDLDAAGDVVLHSRAGKLRQRKPRVYQEIDGRPVEIEAHYRITPARRVAFELARYDRARPLVIDPVLSYSTYLGGSEPEEGRAIAVDSTGSAYVAGWTASSNFPTHAPYDNSANGSADVFITKLAPGGNALVYSTYIGGSGADQGLAIAIDSSGAAYVAGFTNSTDFPVQAAFDATYNGGNDAFALKLAPSGAVLAYSTYLGGSANDSANSIAVDPSGSAYVAGETRSPNFPAQAAIDATLSGASDGFVTRLSSDGNTLVYSTYLGGRLTDGAYGITVDGGGFAFVTGFTESNDFPVLAAYQPNFKGEFDAILTKFTPAGDLVFSTYLGGSSTDWGRAIQLDSAGYIFIAGSTDSGDFPVQNPYDNSHNTSIDGFAVRFTPAGNALVYSTYFGGVGNDIVWGLAVDSSGAAHVAGGTDSFNFPMQEPYAGARNGTHDAFVMKFAPAGNALTYSTYLGGSGYDVGYGVALDASGAAYITGFASSSDFPTVSAFMPALADGGAFVSKFFEPSGPLVLTTITTSPPGLRIAVDGVNASSPQTFNWPQGSTHSISALSPQAAGISRYIFRSWSQGGAQSQTLTVPAAPTTFTASYALQHPLALTVSPPGSGTLATSPPSADGFYDPSTVVQITATATAGSGFTGFTGDLATMSNPASIAMSGPRAVTAHFTCGYALTSTGLSVPLSGGTAAVGVIATGANCAWTAISNAPWITIVGGATGAGKGSVSLAVAASPTSQPRAGTLTIAGQPFTVTQTPLSVPVCALASLNFGQTVQGTLASACPSTARGAPYATGRYSFNGAAGQSVTIVMTAAIDAYLYLLAPDGGGAGAVLAQDDDSAGATNARLSFTLPAAGVYAIEATSFNPGMRGAYTLRLDSSATLLRAPMLGVMRNGQWLRDAGGATLPNVFGETGDLPVAGDWNRSGVTKIGAFRNGQWFLDLDGNGVWDGPQADRYIGNFGTAGDLPVVGDWTGTGAIRIGVYRQGQWFLDLNGNGAWDGPAIDRHIANFGAAGDLPVVGDWTGTGAIRIGVFRDGQWFFDLNGNGQWDGVPVDSLVGNYGAPGDVAVAGDWTGIGITRIGLYRNGAWLLDLNGTGTIDGGDLTGTFGAAGDQPVTGAWRLDAGARRIARLSTFRGGQWFFDANGSYAWEGAPPDRTFVNFGTAGDVPVAGDWTGSGVFRVGVFRAGTWFLDINGNGAWDGPAADRIVAFGAPGDVPVVGNWTGGATTQLGVYRNGTWILGDVTYVTQPVAGERPVTGDWTGSGRARIGVFRNGTWLLDLAGNGSYTGAKTFGAPGDLPVTGDWDGTGPTKIGVYRQGQWLLDWNGNGALDAGDRTAPNFGAPTDAPLAAPWP